VAASASVAKAFLLEEVNDRLVGPGTRQRETFGLFEPNDFLCHGNPPPVIFLMI
jgi:hypothetical protein